MFSRYRPRAITSGRLETKVAFILRSFEAKYVAMSAPNSAPLWFPPFVMVAFTAMQTVCGGIAVALAFAHGISASTDFISAAACLALWLGQQCNIEAATAQYCCWRHHNPPQFGAFKFRRCSSNDSPLLGGLLFGLMAPEAVASKAISWNFGYYPGSHQRGTSCPLGSCSQPPLVCSPHLLLRR